MDLSQPFIVEETNDFAVVFKPPRMHSEPNKNTKQPGGEQTLLEWYAEHYTHCELLHRLDFETNGLLLVAKNPKSYEFFKDLQDNDGIVKEYSAVCSVPNPSFVPLPGFPPSPLLPTPHSTIESYFRPFGPGRKQVRPVIDSSKKHEIAKDKEGYYRTEITEVNGSVFTVRIKRGFRHQIRCHLCWIGCPIKNDPLYSNAPAIEPSSTLALRAHALFFTDPSNGKQRECRIAPLTCLKIQ